MSGKQMPTDFLNVTASDYQKWSENIYNVFGKKLIDQLICLDGVRRVFLLALADNNKWSQIKDYLENLFKDDLFSDWIGSFVEISTSLENALSKCPKQETSPRGEESGSDNEHEVKNNVKLHWCRVFTVIKESSTITEDEAQTDEGQSDYTEQVKKQGPSATILNN